MGTHLDARREHRVYAKRVGERGAGRGWEEGVWRALPPSPTSGGETSGARYLSPRLRRGGGLARTTLAQLSQLSRLNRHRNHYLEGRRRGVVRLSFLPKAAYLEGRCRGVVRLEISPKAAYLEGRCRGVVRLEISPKAAYLEERCRGVVPFRVLTKED